MNRGTVAGTRRALVRALFILGALAALAKYQGSLYAAERSCRQPTQQGIALVCSTPADYSLLLSPLCSDLPSRASAGAGHTTSHSLLQALHDSRILVELRAARGLAAPSRQTTAPVRRSRIPDSSSDDAPPA